MNYRSQFTKIIAESSFQELLRRLRERPKQGPQQAKTLITSLPLKGISATGART